MRTLLSDKCCLFHCDSVVALYFAAVTTLSAFAGQHVAGKVVKKLGRASLIIFILAFTIFVSSLTLGMYHSYIPLLYFFLNPFCHVQDKIWVFLFT